jgi:hypothetical protein
VANGMPSPEPLRNGTLQKGRGSLGRATGEVRLLAMAPLHDGAAAAPAAGRPSAAGTAGPVGLADRRLSHRGNHWHPAWRLKVTGVVPHTLEALGRRRRMQYARQIRCRGI